MSYRLKNCLLASVKGYSLLSLLFLLGRVSLFSTNGLIHINGQTLDFVLPNTSFAERLLTSLLDPAGLFYLTILTSIVLFKTRDRQFSVLIYPVVVLLLMSISYLLY